MAIETTFFSYSRSDSEFVLRLAKDLREAGENLWLDQLDIPAGSRWDASIEAALKTATRLIVVLSPESVSSNNVMDEVSYALESGKTVIPVMLMDCDTPFRLRRLQRIDFTGDYQRGLQKLLVAVGPNASVKMPKETEPELPSETNKQAEQRIAPSTTTPVQAGETFRSEHQPTENSEGQTRKYGWYIGGAVVIALAIWGAMSLGDGKNKDKIVEDADSETWNAAFINNDSQSYADYLSQFPDGIYSADARHKIDSISTANQVGQPGDPNGTSNDADLNRPPMTDQPETNPPGREPDSEPRHPLKETPFYGVMVASAKSTREVRAKIMEFKKTGFDVDYLWIPDYKSLSGAELYAIYIGPIESQKECEEITEKIRKRYRSAYGLLVSQERRRVQIYGKGRVTETKIPAVRD